MRRACAPHPYLIDIYPTEIVFMDEKDNIIESYSNDISGRCKGSQSRFEKGEFLEGIVPERAVKYAVYAKKTTLRQEELFWGSIEIESKKDTITYEIIPEVLYDATYVDHNLIEISSVMSEKTEARLSYSLPVTEEQNMNNYYAVELNNLSDQLFELGLILYDSEENGASRYYTELLPGKNLIILNEAGFSGINSLKNISNITVRIFTNDKSKKAEIVPGNLYIFEDLFDLKNYSENSDYQISPQ